MPQQKITLSMRWRALRVRRIRYGFMCQTDNTKCSSTEAWTADALLYLHKRFRCPHCYVKYCDIVNLKKAITLFRFRKDKISK